MLAVRRCVCVCVCVCVVTTGSSTVGSRRRHHLCNRVNIHIYARAGRSTVGLGAIAAQWLFSVSQTENNWTLEPCVGWGTAAPAGARS